MEVTSKSAMSFAVYLKLEEAEARALEAITKYGPENFLEVFYKQLGKTYLEPHEKGLVSLFSSLRSQFPQHLKRIDETRKVFKELNPNR